MIGSCEGDSKISNANKTLGRVESKIDSIDSKLTQLTRKYESNVLGNRAPETFYVLNGDTAFVKIDSTPVSSYAVRPGKK